MTDLKNTDPHKSGFVNIIGNPNVGKSTLMNALVGERMAIISRKPQTTRHRLIGIVHGDHFQIVFSDTPGIIHDPSYKMQNEMNSFVFGAFEDADIMLLVTEVSEDYPEDHMLWRRLKHLNCPVFLIMNKIDLYEEKDVQTKLSWWQDRMDFRQVFAISALKKINTAALLEQIVSHLPEGPPYYPKDQLTDKPERFFVSEIIREKILELYHQEIPYSTEVIVYSFKEGMTTKGEAITRIEAHIYVMRQTQKGIILGKGGKAIKQLGSNARKALEGWLETKVFLELFVKIKPNWRDDERSLRQFGYR